MAWTNIPAGSTTEWQAADFARQFAEAICERYQAVAGRETAARGSLDNPYAAHSYADDCAAAPPATPADGERILVAASPSGAFAGQAGKLATWSESGSAWSFATASSGYGYELPDGRILYPVSGDFTEGGHWARIVLAQDTTIAAATNTPPAAPADGAVYAVLSDPTGDWAGHADTLATWTAGSPGSWSFATPGPYMTIETAAGSIWTYGSEAYAGAKAWHPWRLQAADKRLEYRGRTSWYDLQAAAENLLAGTYAADWADTVACPGAEGFDGEADIPTLTLNAARDEAGLEAVDEQLAGGGNAPPASPADGEKYGVWRNPTGAWSGHANTIATWTAGSPGSWSYATPSADTTVGVTADGDTLAAIDAPHAWTYDATAALWRDVAAGFTRKHPREIDAIGTAGTTGQRARYVERMTGQDYRWYYRDIETAPAAAPPASPSSGDCYAVPAGATGAWLGRDGENATWSGSAWSFAATADAGPWRLAGAETAYIPTGDTPSAADLSTARADWALAWHYLTEAIRSTPPESPADGEHYAIGHGATGAWAGQDFKIAKWTAGSPGAWSFIATATASPATVIRVHRNLRAGSGYYTDAGKTYMRTAAGWADLAGALLDHDGTAWTVSTDQTTAPDTVTTYGRIRRGDYIGPHIFNELADFLDVLQATKHAATWTPDPDDAATVILRWWDDTGAVVNEQTSAAYAALGPMEITYATDYADRISPWGKAAGLCPGLTADLEWYFVPVAPAAGAFHAFSEGWTEDVYNVWNTEAAATPPADVFSDARFEDLTRPTAYPATGKQGYESGPSTAPAPLLIARWNFTRAT